MAIPDLPEAYCFQSSSSLDDMLASLNAAGPWVWTARESDTHGDYLIARPDDDYTKVRIIHLRAGFVVDITMSWSRSADERKATRTALEPVLIERVLPAVGARQIVPSTGYF